MTSSRPTILIFDDDATINRRWVELLQGIRPLKSAFDIRTLTVDEFRASIEDLRERHASARKRLGIGAAENPIDQAAILVLDYDLFAVDDSELTAEEVAYLARCYSRCGLIVGINQFGGPNTFDLTLKWRASSFADLNVGGAQLANPGLWREPWSGFRPWAWPLMTRAYAAWCHRLNELAGHLDEPVFVLLGIPSEISDILPREALVHISVAEKEPKTITFRDIVAGSGLGKRRKDELPSEDAVVRVAASRVASWLDQCVLPRQDILVDAPHLASRYPSLLRGKATKISVWNNTVPLGVSKQIGLQTRKVEKSGFRMENWLSRPSWYWPLLSQSEDISEVRDPWSTAAPGFVFCEDVSRFLPRSGAREFIADLPSPFVRRFVVNPDSAQGRRFREALKDIDYMPSTQFAL